MTTMSVVGECFFWYRLTRVVPDKFHRAVKRLCVLCVCLFLNDSPLNFDSGGVRTKSPTGLSCILNGILLNGNFCNVWL